MRDLTPMKHELNPYIRNDITCERNKREKDIDSQ